jgi:sterol-4alpha-carboxylate 3-dehydrogenase (decarboxylating)
LDKFISAKSTRKTNNKPTSHILVIGGCDFLGGHIVQALLAHTPPFKVSVASRSQTKNLHNGAEYYSVDIIKMDSLQELILKLQPTIIINTASPLAHAGAQASTSTTTEGTKYLLDMAAKLSSIIGYVYVSSASIAAGMPFSLFKESDAKLIDIKTHHDPYSAAKATADSMVLDANHPPKLRTAVLRPSGIMGEKDVQIIPSLIKGMKQGMSRVQFSNRKNKFDFVYARNVADVCVCAAKALIREHRENTMAEDDKIVSGEAFFITNGEPMEFWGLARLVWRLAGDTTPSKNITIVPMWLVFFLTSIAEWVVWAVSAGKRRPEKFNRSQMMNCSMDRTFDISKAKERQTGHLDYLWRKELEGGWNGRRKREPRLVMSGFSCACKYQIQQFQTCQVPFAGGYRPIFVAKPSSSPMSHEF